MTWDRMNTLLRNELSAVETYQQALGKAEQRFGMKLSFNN